MKLKYLDYYIVVSRALTEYELRQVFYPNTLIPVQQLYVVRDRKGLHVIRKVNQWFINRQRHHCWHFDVWFQRVQAHTRRVKAKRWHTKMKPIKEVV